MILDIYVVQSHASLFIRLLIKRKTTLLNEHDIGQVVSYWKFLIKEGSLGFEKGFQIGLHWVNSFVLLK